ncbi:MAG TPA: response regulator [Dehalococcoidales bacterium]|nr:response regulator [Dehalococcoidales bacterium]
MVKKRKIETILIIEDEAEVRNFASRVLELEGYHILQAKDSEMGVMLVKEVPVSLVLLDLRLPEHNGWEVLEQIKSEPELSEIPVIVFTASAEVSPRERAFEMGATDYLVKPLSAARLRETVARVLSREK